jgi:hypothetical protein
MAGDVIMRDWIQIQLGYFLTGETKENLIFTWTGNGQK